MHRIVVAAVAASLSITGLFASPALATPLPSGDEWAVQAGTVPRVDSAGLPSGAGNRFYPAALTIHQGDHIAVTPMGPHTVTFNRPPVPVFVLLDPNNVTPSPQTLLSTSGAVNGVIGFGPPFPPEPPFLLAFASPGTYHIICGLHVGMSLDVDVRATGATLPKGHADYAAIAQRQMTRDLASVDRIAAAATENFEDEDGNPAVLVGAGNKRVSNIRFYPASVNIRVGQSITFLKTHDPTEPHTVLFTDTALSMFQELLPAGGSTYDGTGTASSGLLTTAEQFAYFQLAPLA